MVDLALGLQKEWDRARFQGLGVREGGGGMLG